MKKFILAITLMMMTVGLAACSGTSKESADETKKEEKTVDLKQPMMKFYMQLGKTINVNDVDLNAYEGAKVQDPKLQPAASASAQKVAEELKKVEIPSELKTHQKDIETALKDLADSYQAKSEELKKTKPNLEAANATFVKGEKQLASVIEKVGLVPTSLGVEVN